MLVTPDPSALATIEILLAGAGRLMLRLGAMLFIAYLLTLVFSLAAWTLQPVAKPRRVASPAMRAGREEGRPARPAVGATRAA